MNVINLVLYDATLKDLEILLQHPFEVDENDLPLIDAVGNLQRQRSGNPNDKSVEGTVLLSHVYHGIMDVGAHNLAEYLSESIFAYQMLNQSINDLHKSAAKKAFMGELGMIQDSAYPHIANQEFGKSVWHFRKVLGSARQNLIDTPKGTSIWHNMGHMLMVIEQLYATAVPSYDAETMRQKYAIAPEQVLAK